MSSQKRKSPPDLTQRSKKSRRSTQEESLLNLSSNEQRAGTIEKVSLWNFMCHTRFEINLNKHITYVIGKNGSGKSAILTSIILALGGRASATNRGNSVKEFIKKGQGRASIEIYIYNSGSHAYKHDVFGDQICVIRTLSSEGSSTYKLKNHFGKVILSGRDEVEKMVLYFNIQVDNPIAILNQDTARTFLVSNNPKDKYLLLMRATQLHYIKTLYEEIEQDINTTQMIISQKNKSLEVASKDIDKLEQKHNLMQSVKEQIKHRDDLIKELEWSKIIQLETEYTNLKESCKAIHKEIDKLNNDIQSKKKSSEEFNEKMESFAEEEENLKEKYTMLESKLKDCNREEETKKGLFSQKQNDFRVNEHQIKRTSEMIQHLKKEIAKNHHEELKNFQRKQERKNEINILEEKMENIIAKTKTSAYHRDQITSNLKGLKEQINPINDEIRHLERKYQNIQIQLSQMHKHNDNLSIFGHYMNDLVENINLAYQNGKFKEKPIGPLGSYIKVKDSSWIPTIEHHLKSYLSAFLCDNDRDYQQLKTIFQRCVRQGKSKIFVSKFLPKQHNIRSDETYSDRYQSFIRCLDISEANVFNLLIDQASLESILLIDESSDARHLLSDKHMVPVNCKRALTKLAEVYFPDPNYKTYAGPRNLHGRYLQVDRTEAINSLNNEKAELKERISVQTNNKRELEKKISNESIELNKLNNMMQEYDKEKFRIRLQLQKLHEEEENEVDAPLIASMNTEIEELEEKLNKFRSKSEQLKDSVKETKDILDEFLKTASKVQEEINAIRKEFDLCRNKKEEARKNFNNYDNDINELKKKIDIDKSRKDNLIKLIDQKKIEIEKKSSSIEQLGERIETQRDTQEINFELKKLNSYIASHESIQGTYEEVTNEYISKLEKYKEIIKNVKKLQKYHKSLQISMKKRDETYDNISKYIILNVQFMFTLILKQRGYKGRLNVDHVREILDITIEPSKQEQTVEKEVRSLSGGERSFYTVALILAIWGNISCPFYIMDEFDVFMDKVNRTVCLDLLMEHARLKEGNQFIFLTPHNTSSIKETDQLSIERLENPR